MSRYECSWEEVKSMQAGNKKQGCFLSSDQRESVVGRAAAKRLSAALLALVLLPACSKGQADSGSETSSPPPATSDASSSVAGVQSPNPTPPNAAISAVGATAPTEVSASAESSADAAAATAAPLPRPGGSASPLSSAAIIAAYA